MKYFIRIFLLVANLLHGQSEVSSDVLISEKDTSKIIFPNVYGPLYLHFPKMDSLLIVEEDTTIIKKQLPPNYRNDHVLSTGSVYRSFAISPLGGSEFTGGLRMQIQGQLSESMQVSGVLSDESSPIQPEGNTQSLDEIDQVYLQISHPQFQMNAGDIDLIYQNGKYMNISKRLIGLKNNFNVGKWTGSAVYARSKGHYRQIEIKGSDGKQGPYFLDSKSGNRNIIVQAGTERVWLNGQKLIRGENHDYIIDYSTAEVHFTPIHLIHSDTDILIEYQYSDFQYAQSVAGGTMERKFGGKGEISFSWLNESDQIQNSVLNLSDDEIELLNLSGDATALFSGAVSNADGDYIYVGREYYEYTPDKTIQSDRYSVTFTNDNETGEYRRLITSTGEIYYEFVQLIDREQYDDLYSSMKQVISPKGHQLFEISGDYQLSENTVLDFSTAVSGVDQNRLSSKNDDDNTGLAYTLVLSNNKIDISEKVRMRYTLSSWQQDDRFEAMQRDRSAMFYQDWNVQPLLNVAENHHAIEAGVEIENVGNGSVTASRYTYGERSFNRFHSSFSGGVRYMPFVSATLNDISANRGYFRQRTLMFDLLPGNLHPFYKFDYEEQEAHHRFDHQTVGIKYAKDRWEIALGVGERFDYAEMDSTKAGLELSAEGIFGSLDIKGLTKSGWTQEITVRRRIKNDIQNNNDYNFTLARLRSSFRRTTHPIRWDMKTTIEETFTETRALVYDSVGIGLGDFRYDAQFNEYVSDPNGEYIAYTIFTGDRHPTTKLDGLQLFEIDFSKTHYQLLKDFSLRSELRSTIEGQIWSATSFVYPVLGDTAISKSKWSLRNELVYKPLKMKKMIKVWHKKFRNLDGLDSRGHDLKQSDEAGIEYRKTIFKNFTMEYRWKYHNDKIESTVSELRERSVSGHWIEGTAKIRVDQWQFDMGIKYGIDNGFIREQAFDADAVSLNTNILKFVGNRGRIQSRFEWYKTTVSDKLDYLPPESLNGLAKGITLRSNIQGQWMMGRGFSLNLSMNYILDQRYKNFLTFNGEVRAYF